MVTGTTERTVKADGSFIEGTVAAQSSIEVTQGQNGKMGYSVKIYCSPGEEFNAVATIKALYQEIRAHFGPEE